MKKRILLKRLDLKLIPVLFLTLIFFTLDAQTEEVKKSLKFIEKEQINKALVQLTKISESNPTDAYLKYFLGYTHIQAGHQKEALDAFEDGIRLDPKEPLNYVGKGHVKLLEGNTVEGKTLFDKAQGLSKKNITLYEAVGEAYLATQKNVLDAIEVLKKGKSIDDANPIIYLLLGDAFLQQHNGGLAISSYEKAASLDPTNAKPHYKIGLVYIKSLNHQVAIESFNKAITIDPEYTPAYKELGELYYLAKDGEKAVQAYEKYLSLTEHPETCQLRYAFFLMMAKKFNQANAVFKNLVQTKEASQITLRYYAFSLLEEDNFNEAEKIMRQYLSKAKPAELESTDYSLYGKLLMKLNQDSLALENYNKSLSLNPNQPEILQLQAEMYVKNKKYSQAIETYTALIGIRPKPLAQDFYGLGRAYFFNGKYEEASTAFQKLIELQPNMVAGYFWAGRAESNLDPETEKGLAKPYYEKVIEKGVAEKNKHELIEAYSYLGYYYVVKNNSKDSRVYWENVLKLDSTNQKAKEALKALQ